MENFLLCGSASCLLLHSAFIACAVRKNLSRSSTKNSDDKTRPIVSSSDASYGANGGEKVVESEPHNQAKPVSGSQGEGHHRRQTKGATIAEIWCKNETDKPVRDKATNPQESQFEVNASEVHHRGTAGQEPQAQLQELQNVPGVSPDNSHRNDIQRRDKTDRHKDSARSAGGHDRHCGGSWRHRHGGEDYDERKYETQKSFEDENKQNRDERRKVQAEREDRYQQKRPKTEEVKISLIVPEEIHSDTRIQMVSSLLMSQVLAMVALTS